MDVRDGGTLFARSSAGDNRQRWWCQGRWAGVSLTVALAAGLSVAEGVAAGAPRGIPAGPTGLPRLVSLSELLEQVSHQAPAVLQARARWEASQAKVKELAAQFRPQLQLSLRPKASEEGEGLEASVNQQVALSWEPLPGLSGSLKLRRTWDLAAEPLPPAPEVDLELGFDWGRFSDPARWSTLHDAWSEQEDRYLELERAVRGTQLKVADAYFAWWSAVAEQAAATWAASDNPWSALVVPSPAAAAGGAALVATSAPVDGQVSEKADLRRAQLAALLGVSAAEAGGWWPDGEEAARLISQWRQQAPVELARSWQDVWSTLAQEHPSLRRRRRAVEEASRWLARQGYWPAWAGERPDLALKLKAGVDQVWPGPWAWSAEVNLTWSPYDGGYWQQQRLGARARLEQAQAALTATTLDLQAEALDIFQSLHQAWREWQAALTAWQEAWDRCAGDAVAEGAAGCPRLANVRATLIKTTFALERTRLQWRLLIPDKATGRPGVEGRSPVE